VAAIFAAVSKMRNHSTYPPATALSMTG
jgi:hypothetical protein